MANYSLEKKIAVALSGGVDSSVAAAMLKDQGCEVIGLHMLIPAVNRAANKKRAKAVAHRLGIPFYTVELEKLFTEKIINYFTTEYRRGRTPNPCVVCNSQIKMGTLLQEALLQGAEKIATGHYARVKYSKDEGRFILYKGKDLAKDQSYFLSTLRQEQLARTLFPLGEVTKREVKDYAARLSFEDLAERESQEVCFISRGDYKKFLQGQMGPEWIDPGQIVDKKGRVLGEHKGIFNFTIGQRRGLGLPDTTPFYVISLDVDKKQVIIGKEKDLYRQDCLVKDLNWVSVPGIGRELEVLTRIRYKHKEAPSVLRPLDDDTVQVRFYEPQRAITPGQVAVFYKDDMVVGGGFIA